MPHADTPMPYAELALYPHLSPLDAGIWSAFIRNNPAYFERCWYDVRVGDSAPAPDDTPQKIAQAWDDLTRWRIDVIGERAKTLYVIELKPHAGAHAIGQALAYAKLYDELDDAQVRIVPVVLTDFKISTTARIAVDLGVELWDTSTRPR